MHPRRRFCVADVATAEELAEKLTEHDWTTCTGFRHGGLLFLNDSTGPNGAQEYAVLTPEGEQVESITFGWCSREKGLDYVRRLVAGELRTAMGRYELQLEAPGEHRDCARCA